MHSNLQGRFPLIGIAAKAQSGKSTMANFLRKTTAYREVSFAEPLRQFVCDLIGIERASLDDPAVKEGVIEWIGKSPRQMMQSLGTEWGRGVHPDLWVNSAMKKVEALGTDRVVISDVRFDNEAERIRAAGGVIVHLSRPDALQVASHASEDGVTKRPEDFLIINDGSLTQFEWSIAGLHYAIWSGSDLGVWAC